jgi:transketolase
MRSIKTLPVPERSQGAKRAAVVSAAKRLDPETVFGRLNYGNGWSAIERKVFDLAESSALSMGASSPWTARWATRRTPRSSPKHRYFETYIAEQQLVSTAVGLQVRGWIPFAGTFAAFPLPCLRLHPDGRSQSR